MRFVRPRTVQNRGHGGWVAERERDCYPGRGETGYYPMKFGTPRDNVLDSWQDL